MRWVYVWFPNHAESCVLPQVSRKQMCCLSTFFGSILPAFLTHPHCGILQQIPHVTAAACMLLGGWRGRPKLGEIWGIGTVGCSFFKKKCCAGVIDWSLYNVYRCVVTSGSVKIGMHTRTHTHTHISPLCVHLIRTELLCMVIKQWFFFSCWWSHSGS